MTDSVCGVKYICICSLPLRLLMHKFSRKPASTHAHTHTHASTLIVRLICHSTTLLRLQLLVTCMCTCVIYVHVCIPRISVPLFSTESRCIETLLFWGKYEDINKSQETETVDKTKNLTLKKMDLVVLSLSLYSSSEDH